MSKTLKQQMDDAYDEAYAAKAAADATYANYIEKRDAYRESIKENNDEKSEL